ncbi:MAG: hypothetical protein ACI93R_004043 [Flavobacteriales bacterium]
MRARVPSKTNFIFVSQDKESYNSVMSITLSELTKKREVEIYPSTYSAVSFYWVGEITNKNKRVKIFISDNIILTIDHQTGEVFMKIRMLASVVLLLFVQVASAQESNEFKMSKTQWWVLGVTGALVAGSTLATHQKEGQEGAKAVAMVGLATFIGVTIYENNKKGKTKKAEFAYVDKAPSLVFSATF